jgi:hypothetical protein
MHMDGGVKLYAKVPGNGSSGRGGVFQQAGGDVHARVVPEQLVLAEVHHGRREVHEGRLQA